MSTGRMGRTGRLWVLAAAMASLVALAAAPAQASGVADYVIEISVDALHAGAIEALGPTGAPNLWRMRTEGAFTDNARTDYSSTVTSPNHFTIFTGRPINTVTTTDGQTLKGHLWGENAGNPWVTYDLTVHDAHIVGTSYGPGPTKYPTAPSKTAYEYVPSVMDVAHDAGLTTGLYFNKDRLKMEQNSYDVTHGAADLNPVGGNNGTAKIDYVGYQNSHSNTKYDHQPLAQTLMDSWLTQMQSADPINLTFLHLDPPDYWGHHSTWDLTPGSDYMQSVQEVDMYLGQIFNLINTNPTFTGKTAVILTADHGGGDDKTPPSTGHSTVTAQDDYTVNFYVWGPGVSPGADLYLMNTQYTDPGTGRPNFTDSAHQPIRNGDMSNLALSLLGLPAIPGSSMNFNQSLAVSFNHQAAVLGDDPIRYWRLGESGATSTAVNIATNTTATPAEANGAYTVSPVAGAASLIKTDTADGAVAFNGSTQSVNIPNHDEINGDGTPRTEKTVELWFKTGDVTDRQVLYEQGSGTRGLSLYLLDGKLYAGGWNTAADDGSTTPWGGAGANATAVNTTVGAGETHHAILVMKGDAAGTGGSITGFLDGRPFGQIYGVGQLYPDSDPAAIGKQRGTTLYVDTGASSSGDANYFGGVIDEAALYNKALATERVQAHTISATGTLPSFGAYGDAVLANNPVAYWQLGETSGNGAVNIATLATSNAGIGNAMDSRHVGGVAVNAASLVPGGDNGAATYNGTSGGTSVPSHANINAGGTYPLRTISLWFDGTNVTNRQVLYEEGGADAGLNIYVEGGQVHVGAWTGNGSTLFVNFGAAVGPGETHQVVLAFDSANDAMVGTLDGQVFGAGRTIVAIPDHSKGIGIGYMNQDSRFADGSATGVGATGSGLYFNGSVDDVALYNSSLSLAQVRDHLAAAGAPAALDAYETVVQADGPVSYWRLNNTSGNGAANVAAGTGSLGNAVTGLVAGGVTRTSASLVPAVTDAAADFNGTSGVVEIPINAGINSSDVSERTIELWFNADNVTARQVLFEEGGNSNGMNAYVESGKVHVGVWNTTTNALEKFLASQTITTGTTYHLAFVFDDAGDDSMTGFLNGVAFAGTTGLSPINSHTGLIGIGAMNSATRFDPAIKPSGNGNYFNGRIDEVALYNAALTPRQVQTHYATATGNRFGLPAKAVLGALLNFDAGLDTNGNAAWEDTIGTRKSDGTAGAFDWALTGVTRVGPDVSAFPGIDHAYFFNGSAKGTGISFEDIPANPSDKSAAVELWFKPTDFTGAHVLLDLGGSTDGSSIVLDGSVVKFSVTDGGTSGLTATATFDLSLLSAGQLAEFIQVVGVIDFYQEVAQLYVNGLLRDEEDPTGTGTAFADWCGTDASGLGDINGTTNGTASTSLTPYEGDIAIFRLYAENLSPSDVAGNYEAVVPEPATLALVLVGVAGTLLRRRRR